MGLVEPIRLLKEHSLAARLVGWSHIRSGPENCRWGRRGGMQHADFSRKILVILTCLALVPGVLTAAVAGAADQAGSSSDIINKYLEATQSHEDALRGASMQVSIDATVPKLKVRGTLKALRKISKVGQVTYRVMGFQGDNTVKNQVIARYLQAEQQGQGDQSLSITPANYKFKFKGERQDENGHQSYDFQLSPRKKKVGLFKGEMWLDAATYLPVMEKGRLVKNPSIFFKNVDFERDFAIKNGVSVPEHMTSTIDTHLIGKVRLSIDYSDFDPNGDSEDGQTGQAAALTGTTAK